MGGPGTQGVTSEACGLRVRRRDPCRRASGGRGQVWPRSLLILLLLIAAAGCATNRVSDLDAFEPVALSRVEPHPSPEELRKRAFEVVVVDRSSPGIEDATLREPRRWSRRELEAIAAGAGASVIDRSLQEIDGIRTEGVLGELEGRGSEVSGADFALAVRFSTYRYSASWRPPFRFLWQSPAEVSDKPGTCTHRVDVELDVQLVEIGRNDRLARTFSLEHGAERETENRDRACPLSEAATSVLFERAMDDALGCLRFPLGRLLAPRGHVTAHRKARDAERHVYQISLGNVHGLRPGSGIEVRREQRSSDVHGTTTRRERVIASGVVTDQIDEESAWVAIDPAKASDEILAGDVARPVMRESLLSSLSGPNCGEILEER